MKKFEMTSESIVHIGRTLYRIKALIDFGNVKAGELGGYIEKEDNLSHLSNAWVSGDARVSGDAKVYGNACVSGNAWVYGNAEVYGDALVYENAWVSGDAKVYENAEVFGNARVYGDAEIYEGAHLLQIGSIGSRNDTVTFFRTKSKDIYVKCGCFSGSLSEFETAVVKTHTGNKHEITYKLAIQLAKTQINLSMEENNDAQKKEEC